MGETRKLFFCAASMKVIVGLGNPGTEYRLTRHNSGVMLVDKLAERLSSDYGWRKNYNAMVCKTKDLWLVKTRDVFMNESGRLLQGLNLGNWYVAHDDLDLKLGEFKVQRGKGPKVHNGVKSIEEVLGTKDFWRIRIGINNRITNNELRITGEEYVLQKFSLEEKVVLDGVLNEIIEANFRFEG